MDITKLSMQDIALKISQKQVSAQQVVELYIERIKKYKNKNAVLEIFESAIENAKIVDEKIKNGQKLGKLAGVPIIIKDNILYEGHKATCASKFLEDFVSPYTSTVVQKLIGEDAIILGRANMDEFAMGGTTETSAWGICKNAFDDSLVPGGSSGGSAVSVALSLSSSALGTDTGGSVRQPASFNGIVGMKPTYGRVSRYGVVAYSSSFDQVGPMTKTVKDNALLLSVLAGVDKNDQTTYDKENTNFLENINTDLKGLKIGIIKEIQPYIATSSHQKPLKELLEFFKTKGAEVLEFEFPYWDIVLPVYYILANAEATSNLARFDGVKYSKRSKEALDISAVYKKSRSQGFGKEVKRRIMLGNYVLSSFYYDAYYRKAKHLQTHLSNKMEELFKSCDVIILPTTIDEAFKLGLKNNNPVELYLQDIFTVISNITSIPAMSVPYAKGKNNLPLGIQILSKKFNEQVIYNVGEVIETEFFEVRQ